MTQPQTVSVEYDELMSRAAELEAPILGQPADDPLPPCTLDFVISAFKVVKLSGDTLRLYLDAGQRELNTLAQSLRNAAKAYEQTDQNAADAIDTGGTSGPAQTAGTGDSVTPVTPQHLEQQDQYTGTQLITDDQDYLDAKVAAIQIYDHDQGASLLTYAEQWIAYTRALQEAFYRCRPFQYWEGEARAAVESYLSQFRDWMVQMVDQCLSLASQAQDFVAAQKYSVSGDPNSPFDEINTYGHPTYEYIVECDMAYHNAKDSASQNEALALLERIQAYSEMVRSDYAAKLTFRALAPPLPPSSTSAITAANYSSYSAADAAAAAAAAAGAAAGSNSASPSDTGTTTPDTATAGTGSSLDSGQSSGLAGGAPSQLSNARKSTSDPSSTTEPSSATGATAPRVKAASVGSGGAGGGVPALPLQAPAAAASVSGAAPDLSSGFGRADVAAGGKLGSTMGAPGLGVPPLGGGSDQGQSGRKARRITGNDEEADGQESLYSEDRAWTESVIGKRRRQDAPEVEEVK